MPRVAGALVLFAALIVSGHAQSTSSVIIHGRVIAAETGDPLRNARVALRSAREIVVSTGDPLVAARLAQGSTHEPPAVLTDGQGVFALSTSAGPSHVLTVAKPGFAKTTLTVTGSAEPIIVKMPKGAVISGTVMDDRGDPVVGASVIVETVSDQGRRPAVIATPTTDDLGEYRAGSLPAGRVTVSIFAAPTAIRMVGGPGGITMASGGGGDLQNRIYYPGVTSFEQAATLPLRAGDETVGVNFTVDAGSTGIGVRLPPPPARDPADDTSAVIGGRVLRPNGHPLTGAVVQLIPSAATLAPPKLATTGFDGTFQFVLPEAAAGTYRVGAVGVAFGYLNTFYGQRRASDPGEEIRVARGETRDRLVITMARPGVVAGRLLDEYGDPIEGILPRASQVRYVDGRKRLVDMARFVQPTDDLGRYRLYGLEPGEYLVSAAVGQIDMRAAFVDLPGYGTTYFPGTPNPAEAQRVAVGRSQEVLGVDFAIARVKTARVSGRAVESNGAPITGGIALTPSRRSGAIVATQLGAKIGADGRFEFPNVPPGEYVLQTSRHRSSGWSEGESSSQFVAVNGVDVTDLEVQSSTGSTLHGRVVFDGPGSFKPGPLNISPIPVDSDLSPVFAGGPANTTVDDDLQFKFAGLAGPRRLRVTNIPRGWTLQSIRLNGIDITDTPLPFGKADQSIADVEVVLSQRIATVTGTASARGRPAAAAILLFAADRQAWYPRSRFFYRTTATADGSFRAPGLAPGEYLAVAVDALPTIRDGDQWQDPDYLETLVTRATRIAVLEGATTTVSLTVVGR